MEGKENTVTRRQAGIGLALLGAIVLLLAGIFLLLSAMQQDSFHLFAGQTHLLFDLAVGTAFILIGLALIKSDRASERKRAE